MVGVTGFEPAASSSRTKHATKLRHTPQSNRFSIPVAVQRFVGTGGGQPSCPPPGHAIARGSADNSADTAAEPSGPGTSVNSVASGRQQKRIGVYGPVPTPALTWKNMRSSQACSQRARLRSIPQFVTSAGPNGIRTWPPCVCPASTRSYPSRGEGVEQRGFGGVDDAHPDDRIRCGPAGDEVVARPAQVRVVGAGQRDPLAAGAENRCGRG